MELHMVGFYISERVLPPIKPVETQIYIWILLRIAYVGRPLASAAAQQVSLLAP